ncbi:hypothetical protein [Sphingomonas sp. LHG3443-2]|uniref:hypothetical protein n=1 Tax=Sphingomonas sp. LHG3443-2 TaxID=2804639 RepID=UPI003CEF554A
MSQVLASKPPRPAIDSGRLFLTAAFFAFCYCLLTWRALLLNEAAPLFSDRRALALLVGAGVFWKALGQLEKPGRLPLVRTASWIVLGTIIVMVARLAVNWWKPEALLTVSYSLRWSLAWAAYFGLWLMGAATFRARTAVAGSTVAVAAVPVARSAEWDQIDWVVECLASEFEGASPTDRASLAERLVRNAGTYELADEGGEAAAHNARLRLAYRIAARLVAEPR